MSRKKRSKLAAILTALLVMLGSMAMGPLALADEDDRHGHHFSSGDEDDVDVEDGDEEEDEDLDEDLDEEGDIDEDLDDSEDVDEDLDEEIDEEEDEDELDFLTDDVDEEDGDEEDGDEGHGKSDKAKGLARALERLASNPGDPEAIVKVAELYAKLGKWDMVAEMAPQLEGAAAEEDDAANLLAALQFRNGNLQGALAELQQALEDGTATADTYRMLGLINEHEDDWYEAFDSYEEAAAADPFDPDVYKELGKAYRKLLEKLGDDHDGMFEDVELDDIPVFINGRQVKFEDVAPQIVGSRTMVPVRKLVEHLGAQVSWDPATRTVTIATPAGVTVQMTIDSTQATVNDQPVTLDVAPVIVGDRTLFPARFVAEALGYQVGWDDEYRLVTVTPPATTTP